MEKSKVAKEYDELFKLHPDRWANPDRAEFMLSLTKNHLPNPKTIIDVGCGNGIALSVIRKHYPDAELTGIDPSKEGIKLAKKLVPDAKFIIGVIEDYDEKDKFDLVVSLGVAEHVEELTEHLEKLKSLLTETGVLYLEVPHNLKYSKGKETYRRLTTRSKQMEWHMPLYKWELKIKSAGLKIIKRYKGTNPAWEFIWVLR